MTVLRWRPARPDEVEVLTAVANASEAHDRRPERTPVWELTEAFTDPTADPERDLVAVEHEGTVVAFGYCSVAPEPGPSHHFAWLWSWVLPEARTLVGDELVVRLAARGEQVLRAADHDRTKMLRASAMEWQTEDLERYRRLGFQPLRWFTVMTRPVPEAPAPVTPPDGVSIAGWDPARSDEVRGVHNAAFADHFGAAPSSEWDWQQRTSQDHNFRPDLSVLAYADGAVVGYLLAHYYPEDEDSHGRRELWLSTIGTAPAWRRRGVASALVNRCLEDVARDSLIEHAGLAVDGASPTGANRLYVALGFRPLFRSVNVARPVIDG